MAACSIPPQFAIEAAHKPAARKRVAAALALSVVVHVFFAAGVPSGSPGRVREAASPRTITAELVKALPPALLIPPPDIAASAEPVRVPPRAERAPTPSAEAMRPRKSAPDAASGAGVAHAPDATYYAARQLDVYPALKTPLDLRYSPNAAAAGIEGRALLLLLIDANGIVDEVSVVEAEPAGYFEEDARRAFLAAQFTPALKNGRTVKSRVLVRVSYGGESAGR